LAGFQTSTEAQQLDPLTDPDQIAAGFFEEDD
jgi:hypothetical protein